MGKDELTNQIGGLGGGSLFSLVELGWSQATLGFCGVSKLCSCGFGSLGYSSGSDEIYALGAFEISVKHSEALAILHISSCT